MYPLILKPLFDTIIALLLLIVVIPLFFILVPLLWIHLKGNPFFLQARPGYREKIFTLMKFRTMSNKRDHHGNLLPDDERLSGLGKWVRKLSLDEIPQLVNVVKGDMSLVGPRPLLIEYLSLYNEEQRMRHAVRPGITGWAQINGRNAVAWQKRFEDDIWYVRNLSFALDLRILGKTILKVFKAEGVSASGTSTMKKFQGND